MKYIFTIAFTFICFAVSAKRTAEESVTAGPPVGGGIFPHFTPAGGGDAVNNKISLRLVAKTYLKYNGSLFLPHDSVTYSYSKGRGGLLNNDEPSKDDNISFDNSYSYMFDAQFGNYSPTTHRAQTFNGDNKILSLIYSNWRTAGATWRDSLRYQYTYDKGKMINSSLDRWVGNFWANPIISSLEYNGDVVTKMNSDLYEVYFTYDVDNNLTVMSDMELTTNGWQNKARHTYQYSGKDITKHTLETWNASSGAWYYSQMWDYTYTGPDVETAIEYSWNGSSWEYTSKHIYTYDGSHNKLTDVLQLWNGTFQNETKEEWTYNNQNLPVKVTTTSWLGAWVNKNDNYEYHFYYEYYFPENIKNTPAAGITVNTYPVPATTELNISLSLNKPQPLQIHICNMQGAIVNEWTEQATNKMNKAVSVANLASGNYILTVTSSDGEIKRPFVVAR